MPSHDPHPPAPSLPRPWLARLRARAAQEVAPFRREVVVAAVPAAVWALWAGGAEPSTAALVVAAVGGAALAVVDARTHRLPNAILFPTAALVGLLLVVAAVVGEAPGALVRAMAGGGALGAAYLALHLVNRAGLGLGDVKLAVLTGGVAAWYGWDALAGAAVLPFLLGGLVAIALLARRRATRSTAIAFGPFMLLGAAVAITWARSVGA